GSLAWIRQESLRGARSIKVVLIDSIAAHAEASHHYAVLVERRAAWKENDSILELIRWLMSVCAGMRDVEQEQVKEWSGRISVDAWREEWLGSEADGSGRYGSARRHAGHVLRIDC